MSCAPAPSSPPSRAGFVSAPPSKGRDRMLEPNFMKQESVRQIVNVPAWLGHQDVVRVPKAPRGRRHPPAGKAVEPPVAARPGRVLRPGHPRETAGETPAPQKKH